MQRHDVLDAHAVQGDQLVGDGLGRAEQAEAAALDIGEDRTLGIEARRDVEVEGGRRDAGGLGIGLRDMRVEAEDVVLEPMRRRRGAGLRPAATELADQRRQLIEMVDRCVGDGEQPLPLAADDVSPFLAQRRDVDRHLRLHRQHVDRDAVQRGELAAVRHPLAREQPLDEIEALLETLALFLGVDRIAGELVLQIAGPDAQHQPPVGERVEHRVVLGDRLRIMEGERRDGGAEPQPRRALCQRRQDHRRVRHDPVSVEMVLGAEEHLVSEPVGELGLLEELTIERGDAAPAIGVMVLDREDRQLHDDRASYYAFRKLVTRTVISCVDLSRSAGAAGPVPHAALETLADFPGRSGTSAAPAGATSSKLGGAAAGRRAGYAARDAR
jgi:hypothetical protein